VFTLAKHPDRKRVSVRLQQACTHVQQAQTFQQAGVHTVTKI